MGCQKRAVYFSRSKTVFPWFSDPWILCFVLLSWSSSFCGEERSTNLFSYSHTQTHSIKSIYLQSPKRQNMQKWRTHNHHHPKEAKKNALWQTRTLNKIKSHRPNLDSHILGSFQFLNEDIYDKIVIGDCNTGPWAW